MSYKSINFIQPLTTEDTNIKIRDKDGILRYTINPCNIISTKVVKISYTTPIAGNRIRIEMNANSIELDFISSSDASASLSLLNNAIDYVKINHPCSASTITTVIGNYNFTNFLVPVTEDDITIKIRDYNSNIKYTINPCNVDSTSVLENVLNIHLISNIISLDFISINDANNAKILFDEKSLYIIGLHPCPSGSAVVYYSGDYSSDNFIVPVTESDTTLEIRGMTGSIKYSINPCNISSVTESENLIRIETSSRNVINLSFLSIADREVAKGILDNNISYIKTNHPCQSSIISETTTNINIFSESNFLLPVTGEDNRIPIRDISNTIRYILDPCSITTTFVIDPSPILKIRYSGGEIATNIEFSSYDEAKLALTTLQTRIDYIKTIFPCQTGGTGTGDVNSYNFRQSLISATWSIHHSLKRRPIVYVMNDSYEEIEGLIDNYDIDNTYIYFNQEITGYARLI